MIVVCHPGTGSRQREKVGGIGPDFVLRLMERLSRFRQHRIGFVGIVANGFITILAFTIWRVLFNNYSKEVFDASASAIGIIQAVREVPGLLGFGMGLIALVASEIRIATLSIVINGVGLIIAGMADSLWMLGFGTFVMSVGFHYFISSNQSLLLRFIRGRESGRLQGVSASWESVAGVAGTALVFLLTLVLGYREILIGSGAAIIVTGVFLTFKYRSNRSAAEQPTFKVERHYWLYYTISFLRGCRRHIFTTFAIYLLVANQGLNVEYVALLLLATSAITILTTRQIGNLTESIGERHILIGSSLVLVFVFLGYAYITSLYLLLGLFVFDHVLFGSSVALQSYLRKIAPKGELTQQLSIGLTMNHVAAVIIPVAGGVMWDLLGYRTTFLLGAAIVALDMCFSFLIDPGKGKRTPLLAGKEA